MNLSQKSRWAALEKKKEMGVLMGVSGAPNKGCTEDNKAKKEDAKFRTNFLAKSCSYLQEVMVITGAITSFKLLYFRIPWSI